MDSGTIEHKAENFPSSDKILMAITWLLIELQDTFSTIFYVKLSISVLKVLNILIDN